MPEQADAGAKVQKRFLKTLLNYKKML